MARTKRAASTALLLRADHGPHCHRPSRAVCGFVHSAERPATARTAAVAVTATGRRAVKRAVTVGPVSADTGRRGRYGPPLSAATTADERAATARVRLATNDRAEIAIRAGRAVRPSGPVTSAVAADHPADVRLAAESARADSARRRAESRAAAARMSPTEAYERAYRSALALAGRGRPFDVSEAVQSAVVAWAESRAAYLADNRRPDGTFAPRPDVRPVGYYVRRAVREMTVGPNAGLIVGHPAGWSRYDGLAVVAADAAAEVAADTSADTSAAESARSAADLDRAVETALLRAVAATRVPGYATAADDTAAVAALLAYAKRPATVGPARPVGGRKATRAAGLLAYSAEVASGRLSWAEVAARMGVTGPALRMALRRLRAAGVEVAAGRRGPTAALPEPNAIPHGSVA